MSLMSILTWIALGLVAGIVAKLILPGKQGGGFVLTTILGIAGAFLGGFLGQKLLGIGTTGGWNWESLATAVAGALIILIIFAIIGKRKK